MYCREINVFNDEKMFNKTVEITQLNCAEKIKSTATKKQIRKIRKMKKYNAIFVDVFLRICD